jgi:hypothetical protein
LSRYGSQLDKKGGGRGRGKKVGECSFGEGGRRRTKEKKRKGGGKTLARKLSDFSRHSRLKLLTTKTSKKYL